VPKGAKRLGKEFIESFYREVTCEGDGRSQEGQNPLTDVYRAGGKALSLNFFSEGWTLRKIIRENMRPERRGPAKNLRKVGGGGRGKGARCPCPSPLAKRARKKGRSGRKTTSIRGLLIKGTPNGKLEKKECLRGRIKTVLRKKIPRREKGKCKGKKRSAYKGTAREAYRRKIRGKRKPEKT